VALTILGILAAYLIGAIPVGFLVARAAGGTDIRRAGSGTIGATNVLRTLGVLPAVLTLVGDIVKGYLAMSAAQAIGTEAWAAAAGAVAAVTGNCWPVFLGFRGGKGVATGLGAFLALIRRIHSKANGNQTGSHVAKQSEFCFLQFGCLRRRKNLAEIRVNGRGIVDNQNPGFTDIRGGGLGEQSGPRDHSCTMEGRRGTVLH